MPVDVSDVRSNPSDQIAHAAKIIGRSKDRRKVFEAIYRGQRKIKTVGEIVRITNLPSVRVLQEAGRLWGNRIVGKTKINHETAYEKDSFYSYNKNKILSLAGDRSKLERFPTKINSRIQGVSVNVLFPRKMTHHKQITIDDIDSFAKVRKVKIVANANIAMYERKFKRGLQRILREVGDFTDWGGETNDLYTTRLTVRGKRITTAFGLKGKATTGILTPKKMGRQGDQIQRLFRSPAQIFIIQYGGQIHESILEQMEQFAIAKSALLGNKILYGIIDGRDTQRLCVAYEKAFQ